MFLLYGSFAAPVALHPRTEEQLEHPTHQDSYLLKGSTTHNSAI
jgi:hypothetical protein